MSFDTRMDRGSAGVTGLSRKPGKSSRRLGEKDEHIRRAEKDDIADATETRVKIETTHRNSRTFNNNLCRRKLNLFSCVVDSFLDLIYHAEKELKVALLVLTTGCQVFSCASAELSDKHLI